MKIIKLLFLTLTVFILLGFCNDKQVEKIEREYQKIEASINNLERKINNDIDLYRYPNEENYSIESTEIYKLAIIDLSRYYENGNIRKIVVNFDGERENMKSEYFYWEDKLFYVQKTKYIYKEAKWSDNFSEENKSIEIDKFYFLGNNLIKHVNENKVSQNVIKVDGKLGHKIVHDSKLYLNY